MHSSIFQITTERVSDYNRLDEDTIECCNSCPYDYLYSLDYDEERRKYEIDNLLNNVLPKGMFERVSDDTIRYNGGADKWKEEFVTTLQKKAKAITPEDFTLWIGEVYQLERYLKNPLGTSYHFYTDEQCSSKSTMESYDFLRFVFGLEPGTLLYIGGVLDYHF